MAAKRPRQQEMRGAQVDGDMASSSSATPAWRFSWSTS